MIEEVAATKTRVLLTFSAGLDPSLDLKCIRTLEQQHLPYMPSLNQYISAEYLKYLFVKGAGRHPRPDGRQCQVFIKGVELHPGFCKFPLLRSTFLKWKHVHLKSHHLFRQAFVLYHFGCPLSPGHWFLPVWGGGFAWGSRGSKSSSSPPTGRHLGEFIRGFYNHASRHWIASRCMLTVYPHTDSPHKGILSL